MKMPIYINDFSHTSVNYTVCQSWNDGLDKQVMLDRVKNWHDDDAVISAGSLWDEIATHYGESSISTDSNPRKASNSNQSPSYLEWKGETGPGKQLKEIAAKERSFKP